VVVHTQDNIGAPQSTLFGGAETFDTDHQNPGGVIKLLFNLHLAGNSLDSEAPVFAFKILSQQVPKKFGLKGKTKYLITALHL
jgi:hypothetical protein